MTPNTSECLRPMIISLDFGSISDFREVGGAGKRRRRTHAPPPSCPNVGLSRSILSIQSRSSSQESQVEVTYIPGYQILFWIGWGLHLKPFACRINLYVGTSPLMSHNSPRTNSLPEREFLHPDHYVFVIFLMHQVVSSSFTCSLLIILSFICPVIE